MYWDPRIGLRYRSLPVMNRRAFLFVVLTPDHEVIANL